MFEIVTNYLFSQSNINTTKKRAEITEQHKKRTRMNVVKLLVVAGLLLEWSLFLTRRNYNFYVLCSMLRAE